MFLDKATSGLNNLGNTCFFNSILQLLYQCSVLNKFIIANNINGNMINIYTNFLESYKSSLIFSPEKIINYVSNKLKINGQEDADEYFTYILDNILEEINKWILENNLNNNIIENKSITVSNLINNLFTIEDQKIITCLNCNYESKTKEINYKFILSLNNNNDIIELLNEYYKPEKIIYKCDNCKLDNNAICLKRALHLPKYLIILLKRYNQFNNKINNKIDMPLNFKYNNKNYVLRGIICHMGSTNGGHYIYFGKKENWILYNDNKIDEINEDVINNIKNDGYIYLYVDKINNN